MSIEAIIGVSVLIIIVWSNIGILWAIKNNITPMDVYKYKFRTKVIGGPLWWIVSISSFISKTVNDIMKPELKECYKENNDN